MGNNPDQSAATNAIGSVLAWLEGTLLGTVAIAVAVIAVASVGFLMLTGRTDLRRGARVILGCFVLFGASSIAAGIHASANGLMAEHVPPNTASASPVDPPEPYYPQPASPAYQQSAPSAFDPYAGAAVAPRQ